MNGCCDHCRRRPARWACLDEPDTEGMVLFGDQETVVLLCTPCLEASEQDGPWGFVVSAAGTRAAA